MRQVMATIAPDGALVGSPSTRAERFLHARYANVMEGEYSLPCGALSVFAREPYGQGGAGEPGTIDRSLRLPEQHFETDHLVLPGGIGIYGALNGRALEALRASCAEEVRLGAPGLPGLLLGRPGRYTHLVMRPETYMSCKGGMGWDAYPTYNGTMRDCDLRLSGAGRAHPTASLGLAVALEFEMPVGTIFCVNASGARLAVGGGRVSYDHAACALSLSMACALTPPSPDGTMVVLEDGSGRGQ